MESKNPCQQLQGLWSNSSIKREMFNRLCAAVISLRPEVPEQPYHNLSARTETLTEPRRGMTDGPSEAEKGRKEPRERARGDANTEREACLVLFLSLPLERMQRKGENERDPQLKGERKAKCVTHTQIHTHPPFLFSQLSIFFRVNITFYC